MIQDALRRYAFRSCLPTIMVIACFGNTFGADRLIRSKTPDRGSYHSPILHKGKNRQVKIATDSGDRDVQEMGNLVDAPLMDAHANWSADAGAAPIETVPATIVLAEQHDESVHGEIRTVSYEHASAKHYETDQPAELIQTCSCESCRSAAVFTPMTILGTPTFDSSCDSLPFGPDDCESGFCDAPGCDSIGCDGCGRMNLSLDRWFGSIELLLMFRSGDQLPPLVTTGPATDPDTTGQLDQTDTTVLAGGRTVLKDITAGGRLTIGAWLDDCKDRSLVARGWFAGEKSYGFSGSQDTNNVLARPFFNVTDGETPADDTQLIVFPDRVGGTISVSADSNVYGADLSIRQLAYKNLGGTIDLLYGYQYMGMDETLTIASRSTSLDDNFAPVGSVLAVADSFDIQNDFHGAQLGIASNYRQGCWSFSSLTKIGFGGIRRKSLLRGVTATSIDGNNATDPNGLLVRSTNSGKNNDDTFGWVPELDFTIGWQKYPSFDVTCGYHLVVMTDALQLSGAIDPQLASNLATNPVGAQRPSPIFRHGTFYVQGIHFGINYIY